MLDIDGTDDPTHGAQQLSFFHGFYDQHMFHPLLVFDGDSGEQNTTLGRLQMDTSRLRLLKVAAWVTTSVRRILVRLPRAFPLAATFQRLAHGLDPT